MLIKIDKNHGREYCRKWQNRWFSFFLYSDQKRSLARFGFCGLKFSRNLIYRFLLLTLIRYFTSTPPINSARFSLCISTHSVKIILSLPYIYSYPHWVNPNIWFLFHLSSYIIFLSLFFTTSIHYFFIFINNILIFLKSFNFIFMFLLFFIFLSLFFYIIY